MKNYYEIDALSQSRLKLFLGNDPSKFFEPFDDKPKKHFIIGSAVDCILTRGKENFENEFYVTDFKDKPSELVHSILSEIYDKYKSLDNYEDVISVCNNFNYQSNWKDNTRYNKLLEFRDYFDMFSKADGKTVISGEDLELINRIVMSFQSSSAYNQCITRHEFEKDIELVFQLPILFKFADVDCKALLDVVVIDHNTKTVNIYDIKTTSDAVIEFEKSAQKFRYDIQMAFYVMAMTSYLNENMMFDYVIKTTGFLVESTTVISGACFFECSDYFLNQGLNGFKTPYSSVKGIKQLIDDYKWYLEHGTDEVRELVDRNFTFTLTGYNPGFSV